MRVKLFGIGVVLWGASAIGLPTASVAADSTTVSLDPKATYLRTNGDSGALIAGPIGLETLGVAPGDILRLTRQGDYSAGSGFQDISSSQVGVFSSSTTLLAASITHRVPGAIAAGEPYLTRNTYFSNLSTDIPEDFLIASATQDRVTLIVPTGAVYLFISPEDSLFKDNSDPDDDWGVGFCVLPRGDMNGDCSLDAFDVAPFELALADKSAYNAAFPGLNPDILGDMDLSGQLDAFDVSGFESALATGSTSVPEPGTLLSLGGGLLALGVSSGRRRCQSRKINR